MTVKNRKTNETDIQLVLNLDGRQQIEVATGHPFFDHLLNQLAFHAGWDLDLRAKGDLAVDDHHLIEDVALTLGLALAEAWRARPACQRYGQRLLPMDEALILCAVDLSGRSGCKTKFRFRRESVGGLALEMVPHFFKSLACAGEFTLHLRQITGKNHHHIVEAAFKALGRALAEALRPASGWASTKGML